MKVTIDTNVLLRTVVADDHDQAVLASGLFAEAETIAVGLQTLAELVWVLRGSYGVARDDIAVAIRTIMDTEKVVLDRAAVDAGLACLEAGGDFADGVIAHEGAWLGGEAFVSFDKQAVKVLAELGQQTRLLARVPGSTRPRHRTALRRDCLRSSCAEELPDTACSSTRKAVLPAQSVDDARCTRADESSAAYSRTASMSSCWSSRRSGRWRNLVEECLKGRDQPGNGLGCGLPHDGAVHLGIPMDENVPGRDDLVDIRDALGKLWGDLPQAIECLADQFVLALGGPCDRTTLQVAVQRGGADSNTHVACEGEGILHKGCALTLRPHRGPGRSRTLLP